MWEIGYASEAAKAEVASLPEGLGIRFEQLAQFIRAEGVKALRKPNAKHIEGKLWELRISAREGIARSLYVIQSGNRIIVLRTFIKKTQKLPRREIEIALARLKAMK